MNVDNENYFEVDSNFEDRDANSFDLDLSILLTRTASMTSDNLNDPSLSGPPPIRYRTSSFKALSPPEPPICCIFLCRCLLYVTLLPYHTAHLCLSWCPLIDRLLRMFHLRSPWRQNTHVLDAQLQLDSSIAESRQASGEKPPLMSPLPVSIIVIIRYGVYYNSWNSWSNIYDLPCLVSTQNAVCGWRPAEIINTGGLKTLCVHWQLSTFESFLVNSTSFAHAQVVFISLAQITYQFYLYLFVGCPSQRLLFVTYSYFL